MNEHRWLSFWYQIHQELMVMVVDLFPHLSSHILHLFSPLQRSYHWVDDIFRKREEENVHVGYNWSPEHLWAIFETMAGLEWQQHWWGAGFYWISPPICISAGCCSCGIHKKPIRPAKTKKKIKTVPGISFHFLPDPNSSKRWASSIRIGSDSFGPIPLE